MKSLVLALFLGIISLPICSAQQTLSASSSGSQGTPNIKFEETVHQFGEIQEGERAKHTFTFTNTGDAPLIIKNVQPSCGCTSPDWTRKPIQPGESGRVTAVYNSAGRPGKFHKSVTVRTNIEGKSIPLFIKGTVVRNSN